MRVAAYDLETNGLLPDVHTVHCLVITDNETEEAWAYHADESVTPRAGGIEEAGSFDVVIITDVRYPNEEDIIRKRFGCIWAIKRPGCEAVNSHESERMTARIIMDADHTYHNQGSVGDLASDLSFGLDDRFGNILEAL